MKPTAKILEIERKRREPWCMSGHKKHESRIRKIKKYKLPKLNNKKSVIKMQLKQSLKPEAGEGKISLPFKRVNFPEVKDLVNLKTKKKIEAIEKPCQNNIKNEKILEKIPSYMVFSRTFSKYNGSVKQKLKAEFKSNFKSNGKYKEQSSKYKAYIKKNQNKKNKSLLKYSMCSSGFNNEIKKKKRTVLCSDLPGKGSYNHRFAYDDALRLNKKGIDVDVLYKVKNKTDSIYVINGEFLWIKDLRRNSKQRKVKSKSKTVSEEQNRIDEKMKELNKLEESEETKVKRQKNNDLKKQRLARIASTQKENDERKKLQMYEELIRKRKMREIEKQLRAAEVKKISKENMLNAKKLKNKEIDEKLKFNQNKQPEEVKIDNVNKQKGRWQFKIHQNLAPNYKTNMEIINDKPKNSNINGIEGLNVIIIYIVII
jgi:hypothetical protein